MVERRAGVEHNVASEPESAALRRLRTSAGEALASVIELRTALGEQPRQFLPELPTLDEQVVLTLYRERCTLPDRAAARARASHPAAAPALAEQFEFQMLRGIAMEYPELSRATWRMIGRTHRLLRNAG